MQPGCSFAAMSVVLEHLYRSGDQTATRTVHTRLLPSISCWMQGIELNIRAEKQSLFRHGLIACDYCRHSAETREALELAQIGRKSLPNS